MSEAAAQYKKQDGALSISADGRTVSWRPASNASPPLTINIADTTSRPTLNNTGVCQLTIRRSPANARNRCKSLNKGSGPETWRRAA